MTDPSDAPTFAAIMFAGWLMVQAGIGKHMLKWREQRRCSSCGRARRDCRCARR